MLSCKFCEFFQNTFFKRRSLAAASGNLDLNLTEDEGHDFVANVGCSTLCLIICDALRDLVSLIQYKKREKYPWRSDTFNKIAEFSLQLYQKYHSPMGVFHVFKIIQMTLNRSKRLIFRDCFEMMFQILKMLYNCQNKIHRNNNFFQIKCLYYELVC